MEVRYKRNRGRKEEEGGGGGGGRRERERERERSWKMAVKREGSWTKGRGRAVNGTQHGRWSETLHAGPTHLRTPHNSAYKTRTEHGRWLETLHAGPTHLSGHHTSLPTTPAQSMVAG